MPETLVPRRAAIAVTLGVVAGFVDAVTFLALFGLFTANMSGNSARLGVDVGAAGWSVALTRVVPIVVWSLAVLVTLVAVEGRGRGQDRALPRLLLVEIVLLTIFMLLGSALRDDGALTPQSAAFYVLAVLAAVAMGVQTSALRRVGDARVHTTFVSGMVVSLAECAVIARRDGDAAAAARARMHGLIVAAFIAGAGVGAALLPELELWSLAVPVLALAVVAARCAQSAQRDG